jgi:hypothetical protein
MYRRFPCRLRFLSFFLPKKKMDGRFAAYGGFLLMDAEGKVVKALAVC